MNLWLSWLSLCACDRKATGFSLSHIFDGPFSKPPPKMLQRYQGALIFIMYCMCVCFKGEQDGICKKKYSNVLVKMENKDLVSK